MSPDREEGEVVEEVEEPPPPPPPPAPVVPKETQVNGLSNGAMDQDDEEDDGRSLLSCGWGIGHDGSAIEIVGAGFVQVCCFLYTSFLC
jgi:hypothetical protein